MGKSYPSPNFQHDIYIISRLFGSWRWKYCNLWFQGFMIKIWKSCFTTQILWTPGALWVTSGRFTRNPFPKMGLSKEKCQENRRSFKPGCYDHIWSDMDHVFFHRWLPWVSLRTCFGMWRHRCGFQGSSLMIAVGSRPLDLSVSTAFQYRFYESFPVNLPGVSLKVFRQYFQQECLMWKHHILFFCYNLWRRKWSYMTSWYER